VIFVENQPMTTGLYQIDEFKDNCGFGLIAHLKGNTSHRLLKTAIEALTCMTHRGGINADGKTGDGCGLLIQKPDSFLRSVAKEACGVELTSIYGVGAIMLSRDAAVADKARAIVAEELTAQGLIVAGWREVPVDPSCLGPIAMKSLPTFNHLFVNNPDLTIEQVNSKLFMARRKAEIRLQDDKSFYVSSLSTGILSYKGSAAFLL
jgi:glutamate synthase (NADPH/NADH) large chain